MTNFFKKQIEKLYYKAFPDRVHDHDIAQTPIPVFRERVATKKYRAQIFVPAELYRDDNYRDQVIKEELASKLGVQIEDRMRIEEHFEPYQNIYVVTAEIEFLDRGCSS